MSCSQCEKIPPLCLCPEIIPHKTTLHVLILQHPQEPDHDLGSARLSHLALPNSTLKIGLSWRNLGAILGKPQVDPSKWAVLYLGSGIKGDHSSHEALQFVSKDGKPVPRPNSLEGIVVLDGTWSQAKALWWRNAWLLKLKRAILVPQRPSLYKELRKEPRRECLSTIESVAEMLEALGESPETSQHLRELFASLLNKARLERKRQKNSNS
ncbi:MAG: DTW domain-containing protein [Gammaproteobacteria bacterium]|nr:DTW domain-containing protein [Gammaproteobacteria bacterium]